MNPQPPAVPLSRAQVREVDRIAIEEYGLPGIVLMENAGRGAADFIARYASSRGCVAVVCGRGNNGGDGFVIARHLANRGRSVRVFLACDPAALAGDAAVNYAVVRKMALPMTPFNAPDAVAAATPQLHECPVIADALLGTGFQGDVRAPLDSIIGAINAAQGAAIFAIDLPSGLDCDTGAPTNATVVATHTVTFVAPKIGFASPRAARYVGRVHVVDIGAPREIIDRVLQS